MGNFYNIFSKKTHFLNIWHSWNILISFLRIKEIRNNFRTILFNSSFFFLFFNICIILNSSKATSNERLEPFEQSLRAIIRIASTRISIFHPRISTTFEKKILRFNRLSELIDTPFPPRTWYFYLRNSSRRKEGRKGRKPDCDPISKRKRVERSRVEWFRIPCEKRMEYHRVLLEREQTAAARIRIRDAFTRLRRRGCTWELATRRAAY